jgi:hypothetical protein
VPTSIVLLRAHRFVGAYANLPVAIVNDTWESLGRFSPHLKRS